MITPNYFLADLPPEAALTPAIVHEACEALRRNRALYLESRPTSNLLRILADVAQSWLQPDYPFRQIALEQGPAETGFSRATLMRGFDGFFEQLTRPNLERWLEQDLGHVQRLDNLFATPVEEDGQRASMARGPSLLVHVAAGNIPNPTLLSMVAGLLLRSAQFVKCASEGAFLPRLFAHSLYEADAKLGACLELATWPGGRPELEDVLFQHADCVTVTGSDETLAAIRPRVPLRSRFLPYGHRVSFGYVAAEALSGQRTAQRLAAQAAADVCAWDQLGCLSPHVIYVENGGSLRPEQFAELLGQELERREQSEPRGPLPVEISARIATHRNFYQVRASASDHTRIWCSPDSTAWTVVYEANPLFQSSCLHRFIFVKSVANLDEALQGADALRAQISTVGLAAPEAKAERLVRALSSWGVTRICPLGRMQSPSLSWRHDGRPALGDLVTWSDWEREIL